MLVEVFRTAVALMVRSMVLSAQSAGQRRLLWLQQSAAVGGDVGEVARLRDENRRLKWENRILKVRDADALHIAAWSPGSLGALVAVGLAKRTAEDPAAVWRRPICAGVVTCGKVSVRR
jgi:hypothetical protein